MTNILRGFSGELMKLAAQAQNQQTDGAIPSENIDKALGRSLGVTAKSGLKTPGGNEQPYGPRPPAPYAVTTPSRMTG